MLERLKSIDYMYWASLIFMVFPVVPVVTGELPSWHLLIDILFVVAYLGVLTTKSKRLSWLFWIIMLAYVAGYTAFVGVNYIWFFFFLANLLIYHFRVRSLHSLHVWTFFLAQVLVVVQLLIFQEIEVEFLVYLLGILTFVDFSIAYVSVPGLSGVGKPDYDSSRSVSCSMKWCNFLQSACLTSCSISLAIWQTDKSTEEPGWVLP